MIFIKNKKNKNIESTIKHKPILIYVTFNKKFLNKIRFWNQFTKLTVLSIFFFNQLQQYIGSIDFDNNKIISKELIYQF